MNQLRLSSPSSRYVGILLAFAIFAAPLSAAFERCCCDVREQLAASGEVDAPACCKVAGVLLCEESTSQSSHCCADADSGQRSSRDIRDCGCNCDAAFTNGTAAIPAEPHSLAVASVDSFVDSTPISFAAPQSVAVSPVLLAYSAHDQCVWLCRWRN